MDVQKCYNRNTKTVIACSHHLGVSADVAVCVCVCVHVCVYFCLSVSVFVFMSIKNAVAEDIIYFIILYIQYHQIKQVTRNEITVFMQMVQINK